MSETKEDTSELCTKCGKFPQSTRKGVQKGLCCNRCPSHGPWCSSHLPTEKALPCNHVKENNGKRKAADDIIESVHPQRAKAQPHKKCRLTLRLCSIVKEVRDTQCVPKSVCNTLRASLSEHCTITSEFGSLQQQAFGSYQQMKAFRMLNQTLNSIETKKSEEVQKAEVLASQAVQEFEQFEKATEDAKMEVVVSSGDVEAKTSVLTESVAAVSLLRQRITTLSSQDANDKVVTADILNAMTKSQQMQMTKWQQMELSATNASLNAASKKQETFSEALDQATLIHCQKADALEEKLRLLPELRSVAEEVMQTPSAARQRLEDFRKGPHASFLEISAELVMRHGIQILDDDATRQTESEGCEQDPALQLEDSNLLGELFEVETAKLDLGEEAALHELVSGEGDVELIGNHSAATSVQKQPAQKEDAVSDDNQKLLNLGGA